MKKTQSKIFICLMTTLFVVASAVFCCDTFGIRSATISALKYKLNIFHTDKNVDEQIVGDVRVEILDNRNICVIGTYSEFLQNRFESSSGSANFLAGCQSLIAAALSAF